MAERPVIDFEKMFQPKQLEALRKVMGHKYVLYGGAAGGGKSYFLRWLAVYLAVYYYMKYDISGVRVGLFCEDYPALRDRHFSKIPFEFPEGLGKLKQGDSEFVLDKAYGGGVIAFRNLNDPSKYLSSEFAAVLIDELTRNERKIFDFLAGMRLRWPGISDVKFVGATNPGSIGHLWVKKLWIDSDFSDEAYDPDDFAFVQALYKDNKYLDESYEKQLNSLPDKLREAYKDGNWDIFEGQYFGEFNRNVHTVEPFEIPKDWKRFVGIDYGTAAPFCALWGAVDFDGNLTVYKEIYGKGFSASEQARRIRKMNREDDISDYIADPAMWAKTQNTVGGQGYTLRSIADIYRDDGIMLSPANNDRLSGANAVREYLKYIGTPHNVERKPKMLIFKTCRNLIRTLPALVHSETKPEDVDTNGEDHAYDALRYLIMRFYSPIPEVPKDPFSGRVRFGVPIEHYEQKDPRIWWR